jgi:hypothetical protein
MLPFTSSFAALCLSDRPPLLPVALGGVTQRKTSFAEQGLNSQDALAATIDEKVVFGVVADGCGSAHPETESYGCASSNEVGARLVSQAVITLCRQMTAEKRLFLRGKVEVDAEFIASLSAGVLRILRDTTLRLCGKDEVRRERFIFNNLMTTILGIIITERQSVVFGCGDGFFGLNGQISILSESSGIYLANALLPELCPTKFGKQELLTQLRLLASVPTESFRGAVVATDGFASVHVQDNAFFSDLINATPAVGQVQAGYDRITREIRQRYSISSNNSFEFSDDATLLTIRRTQTLES